MSLDTRIETKRIALVGPSFGLASVKIGSALRSSPDVVLVGDCWYAENSYERAAGKFVSRVLRTTAEILPMPKMRWRSLHLAFR